MDPNQLFYGALQSRTNGVKVIDAVPMFEIGSVLLNLTNKKPDQKEKVQQAQAYLKIEELRMLYDDVMREKMAEKVYFQDRDKPVQKGLFRSIGGGKSKRFGGVESRVIFIACDYTRNNPFTIKIQNGEGQQAQGYNSGLVAMKKIVLNYEFYMQEQQMLEFLGNCVRAYERFLLRKELVADLKELLQSALSSPPSSESKRETELPDESLRRNVTHEDVEESETVRSFNFSLG